MYKALIFDFFDVIHTDPFKAWMTKHGYTRTGKFAEASRLVDRGNIKMNEFYEKLAEASSLSAKAIETDFEAFSKVDYELVDFIEQLHQNYLIGLLSNSDAGYLLPLLKRHKLEPLFNELLISSEAKVIKPEPEIFMLMLDRLGITANEAIFIDDNEHNTQAAEKLGIKSIPYETIEKLKKALEGLGITL